MNLFWPSSSIPNWLLGTKLQSPQHTGGLRCNKKCEAVPSSQLAGVLCRYLGWHSLKPFTYLIHLDFVFPCWPVLLCHLFLS